MLDSDCDALTCEFVDNPNVSSGLECSCECSETYTISGFVRKDGDGLQGATISAGSEEVVSGVNGAFTITNVCSGVTQVIASDQDGGCPTVKEIPALSEDTSSLAIELECTCVENECYYDDNAYCQEGELIDYPDLSDEEQWNEYCVERCSDDEDCHEDLCINNDGTCLEECSSTPSDDNYDSDCACSMAQNGVCPPGCTQANDIDCKDYMTPDCGDRRISYPYESCDYGKNEEGPYDGQFSYCSEEHCDDCNCDSLSGCGNFILEAGEACEIGMMCSNGSACTACTCGGTGCTASLGVPALKVNYSIKVRSMLLNWSIDAGCAPAVMSFDVHRCTKLVSTSCLSKEEFNPVAQGLLGTKLSFTDSSADQGTTNCYFVRATYKPGAGPAPTDSLIVCQSSGSFFCMERAGNTGEFCLYNKRSSCNSNNNIDMIEDCSATENYCMGPDRDGVTSCSSQGVCDICNGLYGSYSNLDLIVPTEDSEEGAFKFCSYNGQFNRAVVSGCYLDRTKTLFDAFRYCANVASCYDYKSQEACVYNDDDPASDPCGKNQGCEWNWLDQGQKELGGVCRPTNPLMQNCLFCDDPKYNWLTPICTQFSCSLFGEKCNYLGREAGSTTCSDTPAAKCGDYKDYDNPNEACIGPEAGTPVAVDVQYDSNLSRISGTNVVTQRSNDVLGLGKCYWDSTNQLCLRNADNLPVTDFQKGTGADCNASRDYYCEADFTDPNTTILPSGLGSLYPADLRIRFSVDDNYPMSKIKTYFCIDTKECYPDQLADKGEYREIMDTSGQFTAYYYSVDPAKNLEPVKSTVIIVDVDPPVIDITDPADAESFPTNQALITIEGTVDTDARYVCANNTVTKKQVCINSCAFEQQVKKMGCFSVDTGEFTMTLNITNSTSINATRNIVFYAEDFAGNKYSSTMLGILFDIQPPSIPNIIIY